MNARLGTLALAVPFALSFPAAAQDHLEPVPGVFNQSDGQWAHATRVREVLLKDAPTYHLARVVCLPDSRPEWVVTVVREDDQDFDQDAPRAYFVEYVGAERKLSRPAGPQKPAVKRARAPLDPETAESLNRTWRRMLRATRYPKEFRLGSHGVDYHVSRFVPLVDRGLADPLAGWEEGTIWSPAEGSLCRDLVAIGDQLKAYALARPEDREKSRSALRDRIAKLSAGLDRADRK